MVTISVQACQHIYASVEHDQSPHNRSGFQTLFYTRSGLTETEVEDIEARLLYFASESEPIKRASFSISTGKRVVAQIVPLAEADVHHRGGRYLAHSLIFAPEVFLGFGANSFRVFRSFAFATDVPDALTRGDFRTGEISSVALDLSEASVLDLKAASGSLATIVAIATAADQI